VIAFGVGLFMGLAVGAIMGAFVVAVVVINKARKLLEND